MLLHTRYPDGWQAFLYLEAGLSQECRIEWKSRKCPARFGADSFRAPKGLIGKAVKIRCSPRYCERRQILISTGSSFAGKEGGE